jgi:hypothetical protein
MVGWCGRLKAQPATSRHCQDQIMCGNYHLCGYGHTYKDTLHNINTLDLQRGMNYLILERWGIAYSLMYVIGLNLNLFQA